ncbi:MAG: hypothetical protein K0S41_2150 [Anaerocolumna sp.]|jgi:rubrerythrin|nr:hypothetical protein [Anaerocolumna sp.]
MDFTQSKTFINIQNATRGELISSSKFQIYAIKARSEGYIQIGDIFDIAARNERVHAETFIRRLNDGEIPTTLNNLLESAADENYDGNDLYRQYAQEARDEGFVSIGALFDGIANIELNHYLTFQTLADNIQNNEVFCKPQETLWICLACGNIMGNICAPEICPVCGYPQGYYQLYVPENF